MSNESILEKLIKLETELNKEKHTPNKEQKCVPELDDVKELYSTFRIFTSAGFTEEQALKILMGIFKVFVESRTKK